MVSRDYLSSSVQILPQTLLLCLVSSPLPPSTSTFPSLVDFHGYSFLCIPRLLPTFSFALSILHLPLPSLQSQQYALLFTSPVFVHFHLLSPRPPVSQAPDGVFFTANFPRNVTVSQLFPVCPLTGFGSLIHTSNTLQAPQRASPTQIQNQWPINYQPSPPNSKWHSGTTMALVTVHTQVCMN